MAKKTKESASLSTGNAVDDILEDLQQSINKEFGEGAVMRLDSVDTLSRIDHWVSTRSIVVDSVLRGGRPVGASLIPFGRMVEISGKNGCGKSTMCAQIAAEVQAKGGLVAVVDTEERIDHAYWSNLGVDINKVLRIQADTMEKVFDKQFKIIKMINERAPDRPLLMIWDSLGGTSINKIVDADSGESPMEQAEKAMGKKAKIISAGFELLNSVVASSRCCYLFTNHLYTKIGQSYGDPYETPGGDKPKYFATIRLRLTASAKIKEADDFNDEEKVIGQKIRVKAIKNSAAGILMEREAVIIAGKGFVNEYTVWDFGTKSGVINRSGAWSTWTTPGGDEVKFQGWQGFQDKVVAHPEYRLLADEVESKM